MDPADREALHQLSQALTQNHIDINGIANHALYTGMFFWFAIASVIIAVLYFRYRTRADRMKVLQTLAEKGQPIPQELLTGALGSSGTSPPNYITRGIVLISIGLAMIVFFTVAVSAIFGGIHGDNLTAPFLGAFPLFLGLAYLGIGVYQRRHG
jgi:hypothetical protein